MENYIASQRDHIFKSVQVLIYVFDVESREFERDLHYYTSSLAVKFSQSHPAVDARKLPRRARLCARAFFLHLKL